MTQFEKFYDEQERVSVRFVGLATSSTRYDFGLVYTDKFFGKPLVICMQTGRSTLLDSKDLADVDYLQTVFRIETKKEATELAEFLHEAIPSTPFNPQYD